ncbi:MAG: SH3 domain-containing protein [Clostridia bacterium]|nr:SH3 domain-containing protein [Clostridia bacterium]
MKKDDKNMKEEQTSESAPNVQEAAPETFPRRYEVTAQFGLNLRQAPDMSASVLRVLPRGAVVDTFGTASLIDDVCWWFLDSEGGWVVGDYLREADE